MKACLLPRMSIFNLRGRRYIREREIFEESDYFKYFSQSEAINRGRAIIRGNTVFEISFVRSFIHVFSPLQKVSSPLQVLFAWHCLITEPIRLKPSSQLKITWFGKVVSFPKEDPFLGTAKDPQSLANYKKTENNNLFLTNNV